jgi:NAD(P)-dependent dehydrogenase (short-subunit alcohol dehydrogenase family)
MAARDPKALAEASASCRSLGAKVLEVPTDVTIAEQCRWLVDRTVAELGGVDVLINNAGISTGARFDETTDLGLFERVMQVNYLGAVYCTHFALPSLKERAGLLVAISSLAGKLGVPLRSAYVASKHALQGFFDTLRIELAGSGVEVLVVSPGYVETSIRTRALGADGRPLGESDWHERGKAQTAEACAAEITDAMERRRRELVMTTAGRVAQWARLIVPGLVDEMVARTVRRAVR